MEKTHTYLKRRKLDEDQEPREEKVEQEFNSIIPGSVPQENPGEFAFVDLGDPVSMLSTVANEVSNLDAQVVNEVPNLPSTEGNSVTNEMNKRHPTIKFETNSSLTSRGIPPELPSTSVSIDGSAASSLGKSSITIRPPIVSVPDGNFYFPLEIPTEFLNKKEQELRNENKSVGDCLMQLSAKIKFLTGEQELISTKLNDKRLDLFVKLKLLISRKKILETNHEKTIELTVKKMKKQSTLVRNIYVKTLTSELDLRQLQLKISKEKLAAYTEDNVFNPPSLSFLADEEKSRETSTELLRLWTELKYAKEDLSATITELKELTEHSAEIVRSVTELEICKKKSEVILNKAEKDLMTIAEKLRQLDVQKKQLILRSNNQLEKTLVKSSCCRQLKALECRDSEIQGVAEEHAVDLRSLSNIKGQPNNQVALFREGCPTDITDTVGPFTVNGNSPSQDFTN